MLLLVSSAPRLSAKHFVNAINFVAGRGKRYTWVATLSSAGDSSEPAMDAMALFLGPRSPRCVARGHGQDKI